MCSAVAFWCALVAIFTAGALYLTVTQRDACERAVGSPVLHSGWEPATNCSVDTRVTGNVRECSPPWADPSRYNAFWCAQNLDAPNNTVIAHVTGVLVNSGTAVSGLACCTSAIIKGIDLDNAFARPPGVCVCGEDTMPPQTGDPLKALPGMPPRVTCAVADDCSAYFAGVTPATMCGMHNTTGTAVVYTSTIHVSTYATRCAARYSIAVICLATVLAAVMCACIASICYEVNRVEQYKRTLAIQRRSSPTYNVLSSDPPRLQ